MVAAHTRTDTQESYSIGDVAELTGISTDTIRVWERRYGKPRPIRLDSGHRRYTADQVRWLRQIAEALALGHRPSSVIRMDEARVRELLERSGSGVSQTPEIDRILSLVRTSQASELRLLLHRAWNEMGARRFLENVVMPALEKVGHEWVDGRLDIRHEHFLSDVLEDELRLLRRSLPESPNGPPVVFATLSGEEHSLGLQAAALIAALLGVRAHIIGPSVPNDEIAAAARELDAVAVAISVSLATAGVETDRQLADLRNQLPPGVQLLVGGRGARGARRGPRDVEYVSTFGDFERWIQQRAS